MQFNAKLKVILLSITFKLPTHKTSQVGFFEVNGSNLFCIGNINQATLSRSLSDSKYCSILASFKSQCKKLYNRPV